MNPFNLGIRLLAVTLLLTLSNIRLFGQITYTLIQPNGGDGLEIGTLFDVEWNSQNVTDPNLNLSLSRDNGASWQAMATNEPNDGVYTWTVSGPVSNACLIKVQGTTSSASDVSDGVFSILHVAPVPLLFSTMIGNWGTSVFISGSHLDEVTGVKFNGITAIITGVSNNGTQLGTVVPTGAKTGKIELVYLGGVVYSDDDFVVCAAPTFSFTPESGKVGRQVLLSGSGFHPTTNNNLVFFGGMRLSVLSSSATELLVAVPAGTTYEPIRVTNSVTGKTQISGKPFRVTRAAPHGLSASDFLPYVPFETFSPPGSGAGAHKPRRIAVGDLDGDGKPDFAVAHYNFPQSPTVSILRNNSQVGVIDANTLSPNFGLSFQGEDVELADMNADGKLDLITLSFTNTINIYLNQSTPGSLSASSFSSPIALSVPNVVEIAVGDLNLDGNIDLVAGIYQNGPLVNELQVFINQGNGSIFNQPSFAPPVAVQNPATNEPFQIQVVDMDGDGRPDVLVNGEGVQIFRNTFDCTLLSASGVILDPPFLVNNSFGNSGAFSVADFNADGKPDLLMTENNDTKLLVIQNNTTPGPMQAGDFALGASFFRHGTASTIFAPYASFAVGDIDGDGNIDIFAHAAEVSGNPVVGGRVYRNTGANGTLTSGHFEPEISFHTGGVGLSSAIVDVDLDGRSDLIIGNFNDNLAIIKSKSGTSVPPNIQSFAPTHANPGQMVTIKGSGFLPQSGNRPGKTTGPSVQNTPPPTTQDNPKNRVFFGLAEGIVASAVDTQMAVLVPYGATFDRITVLNESSQLTGTSSQAFTPTYLSVPFFGAGNFAAPSTSMRHNSPKGVAMGDLDGDGKADMVVVNNGSASVSIYKNLTTPGTLDSAAFQPSFDIPVQNDPVDVAIADLNGDGKPEIILCHKASSQVTVMGNETSTGSLSAVSFPSQHLYWVGDGPVCVKVGDLNDDGKPDLTTANFTMGNFSVLENQHTSGAFGMSSFATTREYDGDLSECTSIAIGQLDNEGGLDIAVTNQNTNTVQVFRNKYHEGVPAEDAFKPGQIMATGTLPQSVKIADFDGDGKQDLVVACSELSNPAITLFQNQSSPGSLMDESFSEPIPLGNAGFLEELEVADMNGDGRLDLIAVEGATDRMYIYPNINTPGTPLQELNFDNRFNKKVKRLPTALAVGDLDNDGRPDIVTSNNLHNSLSIIHNDPRVSVTASAGEHGSITPSGTFSLSPFSNPEFVIEPAAGYEVDEFLVNGEPVANPELDPFVLENLDGDRTIHVTFRLDCPDLSFITVPGNQQVVATIFCEQLVTYLVAANNVNEYTYRLTGATSDTGSGTASGHMFKVGTTHVKIYAYNSCNEVIVHQFDVVMQDVEIPVMTCPANMEVMATNGSATVAFPDPTYSDNCTVVNLAYSYFTPSVIGGGISVNSSPVGIHSIGTVNLLVGLTTVTYMAQDAAGNATSCTFTVNVLPGNDLPPAKPVISPATGTFSGPQMVSITSATPEAAIYYTVSGNTPVVGTGFTKLYVGPFQVLETTTVRAISVKSGFPNSAVDVAFITISNPGKVAKPVISPNGGTFDGSVLVTISTTTSGAQIYYTTNGNTPRFDVPNSFTKLYTGSFTLFNTASVKAIAVKSGIENSTLATVNFVVNAMAFVATPTFNPAPGNYPSAVSLNITCSTPEVTIYYTTNGNVPRLDVPNGFTKLYSGPVSILVSTTVRAIAVKSGMQQSATAVGIYTIGPARLAPGDVDDEPVLWYESSVEPKATFVLSAYPNPSDGRFTLSAPSSGAAATLTILNLLGQEVWKEEMEETEIEKEIDIQSQPAGIYTLVYQSNSMRKTLRLIKR